VHDQLGADVGKWVGEANRAHAAGLVLDLRGNGGGSMDGAIDALGHFLPGMPMFPLQARAESMQPDIAPTPDADEVWQGPMLALVDGDTASAAEMLAGALAAYGRGAVVGTKTFGKGCVQEYMDDDARRGLLRITTLLYALPDGKPVQRVGITPSIPFAFGTFTESEAKSPAVPPSWRGPDIRPKPAHGYPTWPHIEGPLTPCKSPLLCEALESVLRSKRATRKPPG
jgi:carboxyl-terminal processing protease